MAAAVSSIQTISFRNNVIRARRWRDESILVSLIFMDSRERRFGISPKRRDGDDYTRLI
jgi:hypothetical protein